MITFEYAESKRQWEWRDNGRVIFTVFGDNGGMEVEYFKKEAAKLNSRKTVLSKDSDSKQSA